MRFMALVGSSLFLASTCNRPEYANVDSGHPMGSMHASRTLTTMPNNTAHLLPALTLLWKNSAVSYAMPDGAVKTHN